MSWAAAAAILGHTRHEMARYYARGAPAADWFSADAARCRLALALAEADLHRRSAEAEAWRDYHGATVRSASSLALAIFDHHSLDLDAAVCDLGPDGGDPEWLVGPAFAGRVRRAARIGRKDSRNLHAADERERFLNSGHVVRRWTKADEPLGVRLSDHGLEVGFGLGGVFVRTTCDEAVVTVPTPVPETVRSAMVGRLVCDLIDHPILRDPALVVMDVGTERPLSGLGPEAWTMIVRAPRVPWRAPWARSSA